jgi:hypothetical protein
MKHHRNFGISTMIMRLAFIVITFASGALAEPVQEAMQDYAEFATYDAGILCQSK